LQFVSLGMEIPADEESFVDRDYLVPMPHAENMGISFRHSPIYGPLQKISNWLEGQDEPQRFSAWVRVLN
jgi:hypothetical protein